MSNLHTLNFALFNQLERLRDSEDLPKEIERSKAISSIARDIISTSRLALEVEQHYASQGKLERKQPKMLALTSDE